MAHAIKIGEYEEITTKFVIVSSIVWDFGVSSCLLLDFQLSGKVDLCLYSILTLKLCEFLKISKR